MYAGMGMSSNLFGTLVCMHARTHTFRQTGEKGTSDGSKLYMVSSCLE